MNSSSVVAIHTKQANWIIPVTINIILLLATLWVLASLVHFGIKTGKWKRLLHVSNFDKLNAGLIYTSVILVGIMCVLYLISTLVYINIGFENGKNELCDSVADLTTCFYALVLFTTMLFLWLRQRTFYAHSILQAAYPISLKIFSSGSIVIIFISGLIAVILRAIPEDHQSSRNGCIYVPDEDLVTGYLTYFFATLFFGQLVLLGLFIFALKKTSSNIRISNDVESNSKASKLNKQPNADSPNTTTVNSNSNNCHTQLSPSSSTARRVSNDKVRVILRKTLVFAVVTITLDAILQIVLFYGTVEERTTYSLFVTNSFLNLLFIVCSFVDFPHLLFSPCYNK